MRTIRCILLYSICTLAGAFGCSNPSQEKMGSTEIEKVVLTESGTSWDGATLPNYPEGSPKVTVLKITIPPKAKLEMHKHPVINVGVLTKGELTVVSENGQSLLLKEGECVVELVGTYHSGENRGTVPAEILVFYAGTDDSKLFEQ